MHSVLGRNILVGCRRYGINVLDYLNKGHYTFRGCSFQRLHTMNYNNVDVDYYYVVNFFNECILQRNNQ